MSDKKDPVAQVLGEILRTFSPNFEDEKRFAKYQQELRKKSDTPLLEECMLILDIIDTKTAALLQYIAISLAIFLFLFGMIADKQSFQMGADTKSILSVVILFSIFVTIFAIILCLSCLNIVGAHTVFDLSKQEYENYIISVTLSRRNRYRFAQRMSLTTSIILLCIFILIGFEYATIYSDPDYNIFVGLESITLILTTTALGLLPLVVMYGTRLIRPINKTEFPGWTAGNMAAFGAALSWGIGNYVTRYSSKKLDYTTDVLAFIEIGFLNYLGGFLALFLFLLCIKKDSSLKNAITYITPKRHLRILFLQTVIFKAVNTLLFIWAVSIIIGAEAALLENTHVIWVAGYALIFGTVYNRPMILFAALLVFVSIYLVLGINDISSENSLGYIFGMLSGITYSLFLIKWDKLGKSKEFDPLMFTLLMTGWVAILLFTTGPLFSAIFLSEPIFSTLSNIDYLLQLCNGAFNVGLTYYLISYASKSMNLLGSLSTVVISLALGFSVFVTLIFEILAEKIPLMANQSAGILVFSLGFVLLRYALFRSNNK